MTVDELRTAPPAAERGWGRLARPYTLTGGRTAVAGGPLAVEAMVEMSWHGWAARHGLQWEQAEIISRTRHARSVAEVAAALEVPLGVARVLVADLEAAGHVAVHRPSGGEVAADADMMDSLLDGLRAL